MYKKQKNYNHHSCMCKNDKKKVHPIKVGRCGCHPLPPARWGGLKLGLVSASQAQTRQPPPPEPRRLVASAVAAPRLGAELRVVLDGRLARRGRQVSRRRRLGALEPGGRRTMSSTTASRLLALGTKGKRR
jgi:hypothetical protein